MELQSLLKKRSCSIEEGLSIFDSLEPVTLDFMKGQWKGYEIKTGHFMEGLLEPSGWYGKLFENSENVHPLLIYTWNKKQVYPINPKIIPLGMSFPKTKILRFLMIILKPILKTKRSKARMRMVNYRGKLTGTMVYDSKGILDHFTKIDSNTMLGLMDMKGSKNPYFFILERDSKNQGILT